MRSNGINAQRYREYLLSLTLAENPEMQKKIKENVVEPLINGEVIRFFEEGMLESAAWVGGYIQISQEELEFRVPFVDPEAGYA
jgi:hypothetical protein